MNWLTAFPLLVVRQIAIVCSFPIAASAAGTPPLITDDPGTPGHGRWEINVGWSQARRVGVRASELPAFEFNYGLGERFQLQYAAAVRVQQKADEPHCRGLGSSIVGAKWRFREQEADGIDVSLHPHFELRRPGSSAVRKGLVADENFVALPFQFQRTFGATVVFAEVGHVFPSKSASEWLYGVAICRDYGDRLTLGLELNGASPHSLGRDVLTINFGAHLAISPRVALRLAVGRELRNAGSPRATVVTHAGWQFQL